MAAPKKAVVVTGASSGIGQAIALHLVQQGYVVFATVRNPANLGAMEELQDANLIPIAPVDLTQCDQIQAATDTITARIQSMGLEGLYAIINNAGGGEIAPLELLDMDILEQELKTRIVGPARLVQSLLPEIRKGQGRLLWITTPSLVPLPYKSSIHVAEFARHGLARSFRIEFSPWNIPSIMIACGGIKSNAVGRMDRVLSANLNSWSQDQLALYGAALENVLERDAKIAESGIDPVEVAEIVEGALRNPNPKAMYKVGVSKQFETLSSLPEEKVDDFFISMIKNNDKHISQSL